MRLRGDRLLKRTLGTLVGIGFLAFGIFSAAGSRGVAPAVSRDRALWFGVTLIIAGLLAILASLTANDLDNIWCRPPRRWPRRDASRPPQGDR